MHKHAEISHAHSTETEVPLRHYAGVLTRSWQLIVGCALVGAVLGLVASFIVPSSYTATTTVYGSVISTAPFSNASRFDEVTEVEIASSYDVAKAAADTLKVSPEGVQNAITVAAVPSSQVLKITYRASDAQAAQAGADAVANAYLSRRTAETEARVKAAIAHLDEQSAALQAQFDTLAAEEAKAAAGSPAALTAQSKREAIALQLNTLASSRADLQKIDTSGGSVITPATAAPAGQMPGPLLVVVSGLVLGLLVGLVVAYVRTSVAGRVRLSDDITVATGLRILSVVDDSATSRDDAVMSLREQIRAVVDKRDAVVALLDLSDQPSSKLAVALGESLAAGGDQVRVLVSGSRPVVAPQNLRVERLSVDQFDAASSGSGLRVLSAASADSSAAVLAAHRVCDVAVVIVGDGTSTRQLRTEFDRFMVGHALMLGAIHRTGTVVSAQQS